MGNEYNVIEEGIIQCACGGKVTLTSTVQVERIAGKKPLYLKDIIGAPVACPRSKNPCSVVSSVSNAGTEINVSASGKTYLLRTCGFKTDKGRAVVLVFPGQTTSKIASIPVYENIDVEPDKPLESILREEKKTKQKEK